MQSPTQPNVKATTAATYDAAADLFDAPVNAFWDRIGRRAVERMSLKRGAHVLDACCGSGASAIPAAEAVGPSGRVMGIDLAEKLLGLARAKTLRRGLAHADFRLGDIEALDLAAETFDAVICVFGIFFLPDMNAGVRRLWRLVRPGGQLAITTWGGRVFEPGRTALLRAVRKERPDLYKMCEASRQMRFTPSRARVSGAWLLVTRRDSAGNYGSPRRTRDFPGWLSWWSDIDSAR